MLFLNAHFIFIPTAFVKGQDMTGADPEFPVGRGPTIRWCQHTILPKLQKKTAWNWQNLGPWIHNCMISIVFYLNTYSDEIFIIKSNIQTCNFLSKTPSYYYGPKKDTSKERINKLTTMHVSMVYQIQWISFHLSNTPLTNLCSQHFVSLSLIR